MLKLMLKKILSLKVFSLINLKFFSFIFLLSGAIQLSAMQPSTETAYFEALAGSTEIIRAKRLFNKTLHTYLQIPGFTLSYESKIRLEKIFNRGPLSETSLKELHSERTKDCKNCELSQALSNESCRGCKSASSIDVRFNKILGEETMAKMHRIAKEKEIEAAAAIEADKTAVEKFRARYMQEQAVIRAYNAAQAASEKKRRRKF